MSVRIHILSDLHLNVSMLKPDSAAELADIIIAPGDIWTKTNGISMLRVLYPNKIIVTTAGNHESYHTDINENMAAMHVAADKADIHFLENQEAIITVRGEKIRVLGATLWTDFELFGAHKKCECMLEASKRLNDFRCIKNGEWKFSPADSIQIHKNTVSWLKNKIDERFDGATIIATHHAPSFKSVVTRYKDDLLSACFASNLDYLMDGSKVDLWVHGHMHDSLDYQLNGTRVICNPRGYTRYSGGEENCYFNPSLIIEVSKGKVNIITKSELPAAQVDTLSNGITTSMIDDIFWSISNLQVRGLGSGIGSNEIEYVDIWELKLEHRNLVREIVLEQNLHEFELEGHNAILPVMYLNLKYLFEAIHKKKLKAKNVP